MTIYHTPEIEMFFNELHKEIDYKKYVFMQWIVRVGTKEIICFDENYFSVYTPVQKYSACACFDSRKFSWYSLRDENFNKNKWEPPGALTGVSLIKNMNGFIFIGSDFDELYIVDINSGLAIDKKTDKINHILF